MTPAKRYFLALITSALSTPCPHRCKRYFQQAYTLWLHCPGLPYQDEFGGLSNG